MAECPLPTSQLEGCVSDSLTLNEWIAVELLGSGVARGEGMGAQVPGRHLPGGGTFLLKINF